VQIKPLALAAKPGRNDKGLVVDSEPYVAHESLVQNGIHLLLVVDGPLGQPLDLNYDHLMMRFIEAVGSTPLLIP
jgi:hypothetical protein